MIALINMKKEVEGTYTIVYTVLIEEPRYIKKRDAERERGIFEKSHMYTQTGRAKNIELDVSKAEN